MKRFIVSICALIASAALVQAGDQVRRYQLFEGSYLSSWFPPGKDGKYPGNMGDELKLHGIFRIDTATGEVWELDTGADHKGAAYSEWRPVGLLPRKNVP